MRRSGHRAAPWLGIAGAVLLAVSLASVLVLPARAAAPTAADRARLDVTIRFLQEIQNPDGGFGGRAGAASDPLFSAWVAIALAAGGVNPRDQARPGGVDVYAYVTAHAAALASTTDYERAALVAVAAGSSPRDFGGVDLVSAILGRQLPSGAFRFEAGGSSGYVNATAFAILPLSTLHEPVVDAALQRGADWLLSVQEPSGGWGHAPGIEPSSDITAAAIQALDAIGRTDTVEEQRAWDCLRALQNDDGGFGFSASEPDSNAASTAWTVQAMWASGIDPATFSPARPSPLAYLASLQRADGSIAWKAGSDLNPVWMTAYSAPAYGGRALPVPAVPRAVQVPDPPSQPGQADAAPEPPHVRSDVTGQGGVSRTRGAVIAGGGGRGARLFSRPQPQSQGAATGGVRDVMHANGPRAASHRRGSRRRGADDGERTVTGVVVGGGHHPAAPVAPGLGGAQAGGAAHGPALALALAGALLLCAGLGAGVERRRPGALA